MKRLFKFRYPKIVTLIIAIVLAYIIFSNPKVGEFVANLGTLSYLGVFIAGMLFTFGFTSPFSAGFFIALSPQNLFLAAIIGGAGALFSDLVIFKFIRITFEDEFYRLRHTKAIRKVEHLIETMIGHKIKMYLMYVFAGFLIASPLPDEAGVVMLAGLTKIKTGALAILSFILNTLGILVLLTL